MAEPNPHRRIARIFALGCYLLAGIELLAGVFFTLAAATMDLSQLKVRGVTNQRMAVMVASMFVIVVVMTVLVGWRVQVLFGQLKRRDKSGARSVVAGLRLGGLGCALWSLPSTFTVLMTGKILATGEAAGMQDIFVGGSGFVLVIILMLALAHFIRKNFVQPRPEDGTRAYHSYRNVLQASQLDLADPQARTYLQEQTMEVLPKLDSLLKSALLADLSLSKLLTGNIRIELRNADFCDVDVRLISLPEADLREIILERALLQGAILPKVDLYKARLKGANLSSARLQKAHLEEADMTEAILEDAKLREANLTKATLIRANLSRSNLAGANLSHAILQGANLQHADLTGAVLKDADLRGASLAGAIVTFEQLDQAIR